MVEYKRLAGFVTQGGGGVHRKNKSILASAFRIVHSDFMSKQMLHRRVV